VRYKQFFHSFYWKRKRWSICLVVRINRTSRFSTQRYPYCVTADHHSCSFHVARGVSRLGGARGKKKNWRPHVRTWTLSEANLLYWRKYLWHCWDISASTRSDSAPGKLDPPLPPRYAFLCGLIKVVFSIFELEIFHNTSFQVIFTSC